MKVYVLNTWKFDDDVYSNETTSSTARTIAVYSDANKAIEKMHEAARALCDSFKGNLNIKDVVVKNRKTNDKSSIYINYEHPCYITTVEFYIQEIELA